MLASSFSTKLIDEVEYLSPPVVRVLLEKRKNRLAAGLLNEKSKIRKIHHPLLHLPSNPPQARDVFWSKAQVRAREHLSVRQVLAALNRLWKPDAATPVDLTKSLR